MGVHSFWDIVGPTARPVRLESLENKRMAVDASIWIYQFLKAVRDQEGNALKNSHIVGFFRRICKLLFFGIKPVFIFDGGVPVLKRQTIQQRKERRQGKRDSAAKTARKLLAIQLQKQQEQGQPKVSHSKQSNDYDVFKPQDEWDLPIIPGFKYDENDRRIVSEEAFKSFKNSVEDEFDNIDLESINPASAEFEELPKSTQYLILSTLRLRSRLRMGYSKEQLENLFPNSMDFSKFQIDMVKRRNFFTQKLMGATGTLDGDASGADDEVVNRISGQRNKEYKLTKTENGWILGLGDLDGSENTKAILLDENNNSNTPAHQSFDKKRNINEAMVDDDGDDDDDDDDDGSSEWEDIDTRPQNSKPIQDYSIKAARLPQLTRVGNSAGSQSFLDKRHDHVSPVKRSPTKIIPHLVEEEDFEDNNKNNNNTNYDDEEEDDDDDDDDDEQVFERHLQEMEMMEAIQKSRRETQGKSSGHTVLSLEEQIQPQDEQIESYKEQFQPRKENLEKDSGVSCPGDYTALRDAQFPAITESKRTLSTIINKIPDFDFGQSSSFLFEEPVVKDGQKNKQPSEKEAKSPVQEMPAWFKPSLGKEENPYGISNFVEDKEMANSKHSDNFKLVTGLQAERLIKSAKRKEENIIEISDSDGDVPENSNNKMSQDRDIGARQGEKSNSVDPMENPREPGRQPLAFDYDFSEEEEDNIAENMRKEEQEFYTFKNNLNNTVAENAFLEDELYEQQVKDKRDSDEVTTDMIIEVQELLSRFGIPYITAPMEAEAQCAELLKLGLVDGIITDDSDVFLFGGTKIYKNMFHERNYVEFYDMASISKNLGLDRDSMIDLAQLLGSDYTPGVKSMGPVSSMEVLAEFGTLVKLRNWYIEGQFDKKKQENEEKFKKDLRKKLVKNEVVLDSEFPNELVRDAYLHPEVDHDKNSFSWGTPDLDMLRVFMKKRIGWPQEKTDEVLIPLIRDINNRKKQSRQMTLTEFFPTEYIQHEKKMNFGKRISTATGKLKHRKLK